MRYRLLLPIDFSHSILSVRLDFYLQQQKVSKKCHSKAIPFTYNQQECDKGAKRVQKGSLLSQKCKRENTLSKGEYISLEKTVTI
jgi:hypothetical protein